MPRNWKFTVGAATYTVETDFWVEYKAAGDPSRLGIVVHAAWERIGLLASTQLARRQAAETRLLELSDLVSRQGTLKVDDGETGDRTFFRVVLESINHLQVDNSKMVEYDLNFAYPIGAGGTSIVRKFFAEAYINPNPGNPPPGTDMESETDFLMVQRSIQDKTVFKDVFRNAPVRVPSGPDMTVVRLTGIRQVIPAPLIDTLLTRRQAAEAMLAAMLPNVSKEFDLLIDGPPVSTPGIAEGIVHLRSVTVNRQDLPDAIVYDLEFVKGYVD